MTSSRRSPLALVGYTHTLVAVALTSLLLGLCCTVQASSLRTSTPVGTPGAEPGSHSATASSFFSLGGLWGGLTSAFHVASPRQLRALKPLRTFRSDLTLLSAPRPPSSPPPPSPPPSPPPPAKSTTVAVSVPCSVEQIRINVYNEADFAKRLQYPPSQAVYMAVQNSITLSKGLIFNSSYACTIVNNTNPSVPLNITYPSDTMPLLTIYNSSNIWFQGVNLIFGTKNTSLACTFGLIGPGKESNDLTCPGVYVAYSFGVQINQAFVYGRMDIFRSTYVVLDHLTVTSAQVYKAYPSPFLSYNTHGFIRMGENGVGADLVPSNNVISNCEVYGGWELITLYRGAMGVTVTNNYLHDYMFAGVRCGADTGSQFDCYMNNLTNNFIANPWWYSSSTTDINNAGIYTCTHFHNPGNLISCNYIYNARWCYYLDMASSGLTISGGVCNGSYATVKVNGGKFNKMDSIISVQSSRFLTYYSCITKNFGNCLHPTGNNWEAIRRAYYDTPTVNTRFPEMRKHCNTIPSVINNYTCNPPNQTTFNSTVTGYCSGFMWGNVDESFTFYNQPRHWGDYNSCGPPDVYANTTVFNKARWYNITSNPGFATLTGAPSSTNDDYALSPTSRLYTINPAFRSCPRASVGPTLVTPGTILPLYLSYFNIPQPTRFQDMTKFPFNQILNQALSVPISNFTINLDSIDVPY